MMNNMQYVIEKKIDSFVKATTTLSSFEGVVVDMEVFWEEITKFGTLMKAMEDVDYAMVCKRLPEVNDIIKEMNEAITKLDVLRFTKINTFKEVLANMNAVAREIDVIEQLGEQLNHVCGRPNISWDRDWLLRIR